MVEVTQTDVRRAAMDFLARREHSRQELQVKLRKKYADRFEALIDDEIDKLQQEGLQSDARLAEALVRSRVSRGQGPVKIAAELRSKGVDAEVAALALESCDVNWSELAGDVARKRFGTAEPVDARDRAKRVRFLQQRGFTFEQISVLERIEESG